MANALTDTSPIVSGLPQIAQDRGIQMLDEIIDRHKAAGQYTTGQTSRSLKIKPTTDGFQLTGWKYAGTYDEGRKPGKMPPVAPILAWIQAKGLTFSKPGQAQHYAFAIARVIAQRGTQRFRSNEDIFQTPIREMSEDLALQSTKYLQAEIARILLRSDLKQTP